MSVANLTRYDMGVVECSIGNDVDIIPVANGEFVKFEEAIEASSNSLQQLKAEIAALVQAFSANEGCLGFRNRRKVFLNKLRQLSAI